MRASTVLPTVRLSSATTVEFIDAANSQSAIVDPQPNLSRLPLHYAPRLIKPGRAIGPDCQVDAEFRGGKSSRCEHGWQALQLTLGRQNLAL